MIKIGLTGSIGMGKSTVAKMFGDLGAMEWDADAAVHRMYARGGAAVEPVGALFPDVIVDGAVDRARLASVALGAPANLQKLEAVVHPLVAADREAFMTAAAHAGAPAVVLDIPLLFENGSEKFFDVVVVVSAPADVQRARALARPGMSEEKFAAILAEQMPDAEKCAKADYVISTGQTLAETRGETRRVYEKIMARARP
jgi:dephospho-CoA kinase